MDPICTEVKDEDPRAETISCQTNVSTFSFPKSILFKYHQLICSGCTEFVKSDFSIVNRRSNRHAKLLPAELK